MVIRSGKGDEGFTELHFSKHIGKESLDIRAIGDLDELNSFLGLIKAKTRSRKEKKMLEHIQLALVIIASEISIGAEKKKKHGILLKKEDTDWIKQRIYDLEKDTKIENCFRLPGECEQSALCDVARAVARRAERSVVELFHKDKVKDEFILSYLNCISDILFILARKKAKKRAARRKKRKSAKKNK
ncbi:MAG: cob(I)yrinic acid a,c-diamide adenosyltransferase [Candidatus Omnitrophica bacterium]|nr:cob(I)yrinic acid a,c-diamide adenosyltransferase [Candidatus Omnitrophota bacterium]